MHCEHKATQQDSYFGPLEIDGSHLIRLHNIPGCVMMHTFKL